MVKCDECGKIENEFAFSEGYPNGWLKSGNEDICLNCRLDAIERTLLGKRDAKGKQNAPGRKDGK